MAIALFEHNRIAYEAAVSLLNETGKAAIVHPTGTGKSFIALRGQSRKPHLLALAQRLHLRNAA